MPARLSARSQEHEPFRSPLRAASLSCMKQIWTGRMGQAAARYRHHPPMPAVYFNVCRVCVSSNVLGFIFGGIAAAGLAVLGFAKRFARPS